MRAKFVPQPVWNLMLLSELSARLVPPTPVANGELGGKSTLTKPTPPGKLGGKDSSPKSPLEKLTSMPFAAAISRMRVSRLNWAGFPRPSTDDQLFEIVLPSPCTTAR